MLDREAQRAKVDEEERDKEAHKGIRPAPDDHDADEQESKRRQHVPAKHIECIRMQGDTSMLKSKQGLRVQLIGFAAGNRYGTDCVQGLVENGKADDKHEQVAEHEDHPEPL